MRVLGAISVSAACVRRRRGRGLGVRFCRFSLRDVFLTSKTISAGSIFIYFSLYLFGLERGGLNERPKL